MAGGLPVSLSGRVGLEKLSKEWIFCFKDRLAPEDADLNPRLELTGGLCSRLRSRFVFCLGSSWIFLLLQRNQVGFGATGGPFFDRAAGVVFPGVTSGGGPPTSSPTVESSSATFSSVLMAAPTWASARNLPEEGGGGVCSEDRSERRTQGSPSCSCACGPMRVCLLSAALFGCEQNSADGLPV